MALSERARYVLVGTFSVLGWYASSGSLVLMNRWAFGVRDGGKIPPTFISVLHMAIKTLMAICACTLSTPWQRSTSTGSTMRRLITEQQLDWGIVWKHLWPIGFATSCDVILSNYAIKLVDVSVYTVCKSTAVLWAFGLSVLMQLLPLSASLATCVLTLLAGVVLCTYHRDGAPVNLLGVLCAVSAAAFGSARWVLTERYMSRAGVKRDVVALLALMGPFTVISLLGPLALDWAYFVQSGTTWTALDTQVFATVAAVGGILAFFLVLFELLLVRLTSALSLSVIGHAKDAIVIVVAVVFFHESLSLLNWLGVLLTFVAFGVYVRIKHDEQGSPGSAPLPVTSASSTTRVEHARSQRAHVEQGRERTMLGGLTGLTALVGALSSGPSVPGRRTRTRHNKNAGEGQAGTEGDCDIDVEIDLESDGVNADVDTTSLGLRTTSNGQVHGTSTQWGGVTGSWYTSGPSVLEARASRASGGSPTSKMDIAQTQRADEPTGTPAPISRHVERAEAGDGDEEETDALLHK